MSFAIIACSGTLKGVYIQGVLSYFEEVNFDCSNYFSASSSVISTLFAATVTSNELGLQYWKEVSQKSGEGVDMSTLVKASIDEYVFLFKKLLANKNSPVFNVATTKIINKDIAQKVRSSEAKKLGRKVLIELARGNSDWVDHYTKGVNFCTKPIPNPHGYQALTINNFKEVAYASTRMMHAWPEPAFIEGHDYIDASYTASCPILFANNSFNGSKIIIDVEHDTTYDSLAKKVNIDELIKSDDSIYIIKPTISLDSIGVGYMSATAEGCERAYELGYNNAKTFINDVLNI